MLVAWFAVSLMVIVITFDDFLEYIVLALVVFVGLYGLFFMTYPALEKVFSYFFSSINLDWCGLICSVCQGR